MGSPSKSSALQFVWDSLGESLNGVPHVPFSTASAAFTNPYHSEKKNLSLRITDKFECLRLTWYTASLNLGQGDSIVGAVVKLWKKILVGSGQGRREVIEESGVDGPHQVTSMLQSTFSSHLWKSAMLLDVYLDLRFPADWTRPSCYGSASSAINPAQTLSANVRTTSDLDVGSLLSHASFPLCP